MKNNDIGRSIDTVLSGMTVSPARKEALVRTAIESKRLALRPEPGWQESCPRKRTERANQVKLKFHFSLSFGLPHMVVAAIVVIVVMIAPLFAPEQKDFFKSWQSDDGEYYMVEGLGKEQSGTAEADNVPTEYGMFQCTTLEEAEAYFGAAVPVINWLPEGWAAVDYNVGVLQFSRSCSVFYERGEKEVISYSVFETYDGTAYTYVEQDGEGEFVTLADGREIYITHNIDRLTVTWTEGKREFFFSGDFTREEAIRMAESVKAE